MNHVKYIGMDVHQATISVAVLDAAGKLILESVSRQSLEDGKDKCWYDTRPVIHRVKLFRRSVWLTREASKRRKASCFGETRTVLHIARIGTIGKIGTP